MTNQIRTPRISRRDLLKVSAAVTATTAMSGCGGSSNSSSNQSSQPNVLFILVDQLRFPMHFPAGINNADEFIQKFMPNTYKLWQSGVKFGSHFITATACGPSRATLVTGLYTQQTWNCATYAPILGNSSPPILNPAMPTYGKLFQAAGYETPYMGKWHLSSTWDSKAQGGGMAQYGFDGITEKYELDAANLQGTYGDPDFNGTPYLSDEFIANTAVSWLQRKQVSDRPWCLTVGFQNPHDYQFFPSGTEYQTFTNLFGNSSQNPSHLTQISPYSAQPSADGGVNWATNVFNNLDVQSYGYPELPPNWEALDAIWNNKPHFQTVIRQWNSMEFGGVSEDRNISNYEVKSYPNTTHQYAGYAAIPYGIGMGPFSYWQRGMAAYTLAMEVVDKNIGAVLNSIPETVAKNTVIVFTSDHGEDAGSHGFIANKTGNVYNETIHVPLIVKDPTGKFTGDINVIRNQITSAIDLTTMMVSFAYGGTRSWLTGENKTLYDKRFDMFPLLKSATALGRPYALFSTDETISYSQDFATALNAGNNKTAGHVLGLITAERKLTYYANWTHGTVDIANDGRQEGEFYNLSTPNGKLEIDNLYLSSAAASEVSAMQNWLLNDLVPNEMRAPLPMSLIAAQNTSKNQLIGYYTSQITS